ncbi:MAG: tetratricopeptide repeat protein [Bacteroidetes bacterium]|nr:tetratricopeptide repeat protein [Bacteroidota bacterium]
MEERDFDDDGPADLNACISRFEESLTRKQPVFFDVMTFEYLIAHYEQKEQWKTALEVLDYALEQHPYQSFFLIKKAGLLIYFRKYKQALDLLDQAESLDPGDVSINILRSDVYLDKKQHYRSVRIIEESIARATDQVEREELMLELADVYEDWNRYDMVFETLKAVLALNHDNEEALSRMWYCVELAGKQDESVELHKAILDENPYSYLAWHNLGNAYYDLGHFEKSIEAYEFVVAINEQWDLAYRDCGDAHFRLKQYHKAITQFEKAIEVSKPYEDLLFSIGICYEKLKDLSQARQYYRRASTSDPKYFEAFYRIGETYRKEREWEHAIHFYKKALRLKPENAQFIMALAHSFYNLGEVEPLIFACQSIMALHVNQKSKTHYEKLVGYLIDLGCLEDALQLLDFAAVEKGALSSFPYLRAVCYLQAGRRKEGIAWLEEGLSNHYSRHRILYKFAPELKGDAQIALVIEQYK